MDGFGKFRLPDNGLCDNGLFADRKYRPDVVLKRYETKCQ
jgi:hypothetical protein